jgi:hypothetical protein
VLLVAVECDPRFGGPGRDMGLTQVVSVSTCQAAVPVVVPLVESHPECAHGCTLRADATPCAISSLEVCHACTSSIGPVFVYCEGGVFQVAPAGDGSCNLDGSIDAASTDARSAD